MIASVLLLAFLDWPQFRGPAALGVSEGHQLPTEFNAKKNLVWQVPLPPGHSSPLVVGKRHFVTAFEGEHLFTIAQSTETGKPLLRQQTPR
ncbi:MAG: pyrrolo-quinoline quinone, partial [Acidobacteriota bacterium]